MTSSSTPGSPSSDDPMPWSDRDAHGSVDATRPMPPVSRFPDGRASEDTEPHGSPGPGAGGSAEEWAWYDDDAQHTRPMPAVTAQRPAQDGGRPAAPTGEHERAGGHGYAPVPSGAPVDPAARLVRQREEFGGLQLVPGFFGWLSALALTWLLLALSGLVASALGVRLADGLGRVVDDLASGSAAAWTAAAVLGAVEFLAFLGGGYTAGRMARFSGAAQGVSVWLWSLLGRSVATVAGLVWADTVGLAPVGVSAQALIGSLLVPGLLAVAAVLLVDLLAALLGGLWGTRYHRRVDRWDDTRR